jgi:peptidoglycan/xylan/chitin deacetylase (PgdA/CDA1 family)
MTIEGRRKISGKAFSVLMNLMKKTVLILTSCVLISLATCGYSQLELTFDSRYNARYYSLDSIIIKNINTGNRTVNYYPDTILKLIITGIEVPKKSEDQNNTGGLKISLNQNYPNPFDGKTNFNICLQQDVKLTISIYNVSGKLLLNYEKQMPAGNHSFTFSGGAEEIYFLVAKTPGYSSAIKMINLGSRINDPGINLDYNCYIPNNEYSYNQINKNGNTPIDKSGYKYSGKLKSGLNEFVYNPGDSLMLIGYMTNDTNTVISDTIIERPDLSKIITFLFGKEHRVVIILYHVITDSIPGNEYERNSTDFDNDLKYMMGKDYKFLSINDLLLLQSGEMKLYSDGIIITFDDGDSSNYTRVFPLLAGYDIPATFFIVPEWIGDSSYMTWPEVWQMSQYVNAHGVMPFTIGSHTSSHPYLEQSAQYFSDHQDYLDFLYTELEDSRVWIVDITSQENIFLSLPYGDGANNIDIINTAQFCGYKGIRTSVYNSFTADEMNIYALPGISILSNYSIQIIEEFLDQW